MILFCAQGQGATFMTTVKLNVLAGDGEKITVLFNTEDSLPIKCVVIIIHGFGEHAGSYTELIERLAQSGCASAIFNLRGHGMPPPTDGEKDKRGIIPSYKRFLDDIDDVTAAVKQRMPSIPVALYGHSMGGNIAANYLIRRGQSAFFCAVLEAPWLGLYKEVNPAVTWLAKLIGRFSPNIAIFNKLPPDEVTGDAQKAEAMKNDPLYHNRISLRLFASIVDGCKYALANTAKLTLPTLVAYAGRDRIVSNKAIGQFIAAAGENVTKKEYDSCHAIHNDMQRETYFQDVINFLEANIPGGE